jgi:hypothetical protein
LLVGGFLMRRQHPQCDLRGGTIVGGSKWSAARILYADRVAGLGISAVTYIA